MADSGWQMAYSRWGAICYQLLAISYRVNEVSGLVGRWVMAGAEGDTG